MAYQVVVLSSPSMSQYQCDDLRERLKALAKMSPGALVHAPFVLSERSGVFPEHRHAARGLPLTLLPMKISMHDVDRVADLSACSAEVWAYPRYSEASRCTNVTKIVQRLREREYLHVSVIPF
jgi:hypothetical protein